MKLDEFKAAVAAKVDAVKNPDTDDGAADSCLSDTVGHVASIFRQPAAPPAAFDPSVWIAILQTIIPLILAWINRRFPPAPKPAPAPVADPL